MVELARWQTDDGPVVVEVAADDVGFQGVTRKPGEVVDVAGRFENALTHVRTAALATLRTFREHALDADEVSLEFGIKLTVEAGAVIARTAVEGHMAVTVKWHRRPHPGGE
jgi:hypothetical protein